MNKKHLFKAVTIVFATILFNNIAKAQTTKTSEWRLGIGLEAGLPLGDAHTISNLVTGGTARLQYALSNKVALTLTSGYYDFVGKQYKAYVVNTAGLSIVTVNESFGVIPIKAGFKDFISGNFYFGAEAGAAFQTGGTIRTSIAKLDVAPSLGYAGKDWDISARYENLSDKGTLAFVGLRAAYSFGL